MEFRQPTSWADALAMKAQQPSAVPLAGGTDIMVEINFDHRRPETLLDLTGINELSAWCFVDGRLRIGAGMSYARIISELGDQLPALAIASRTVASPQIRNRGTIGGNLGTASPAGDAHPALLSGLAEVEVASVHGSRRIPIDEFFTSAKRNGLEPEELIAAVHIAPATGPQQFSKIGTRNAMVIAVCAFSLALHPDRQKVVTGLGSAAPTPRRAPEAEDYLNGELASRWERPGPLPESVVAKFSELVTSATAPIDDVRGSTSYRRHAISVLAKRTLNWTWQDYCGGRRQCA